MKLLALACIAAFSAPIHAQSACKCNCDDVSTTLCAMDYELDNPCPSTCATQGQTNRPRSRTACPVIHMYNIDKGVMEWRVICY